jgi:hypothetical protein
LPEVLPGVRREAGEARSMRGSQRGPASEDAPAQTVGAASPLVLVPHCEPAHPRHPGARGAGGIRVGDERGHGFAGIRTLGKQAHRTCLSRAFHIAGKQRALRWTARKASASRGRASAEERSCLSLTLEAARAVTPPPPAPSPLCQLGERKVSLCLTLSNVA